MMLRVWSGRSLSQFFARWHVMQSQGFTALARIGPVDSPY